MPLPDPYGSEITEREGLEDQTKAELLERAAELQIEGRSHMTKDELISAIEAEIRNKSE